MTPSCHLNNFLITPDTSMEALIRVIGKTRRGIALVVDKDQKLLDTVTDGDIRRALLAHADILNESVEDFLTKKNKGIVKGAPITVLEGTPDSDIQAILTDKVILQMPVLNTEGKVVDIRFRNDFVCEIPRKPLSALVMAGGFGTRLMPLTESTPKPMLPVGDRPLLERCVEKLSISGISSVKISTHYKADAIKNHFRAGENHGVDISYVEEDQPLGTAGALSLLEETDETLLVINGDILTEVNYNAMTDFHEDNKAAMTVGVRKYEFQVPYGVIEAQEGVVTGLIEKPKQTFNINAGIYLVEPEARKLIGAGEYLNMTDLMERLIAKGQKVICFPIHEYWLDIGKPEDYQSAQDYFKNKSTVQSKPKALKRPALGEKKVNVAS